MKSSFIKQIIICILIVVIVGVMAFVIRDYFFPQESTGLTNTNKDKYSYNEFQIVNVTTEILIQRYFQDFKDKMLYHPEEAYQFLGSNTLETFSNASSFTTFINDHSDSIFQSTITQYTTQKSGNDYKYIIVDQFNNKYTFVASAVLVYKVDIDYSSNF